MGSVTVAEMLAIEASAMEDGWTEEQLTNLAGERLGIAIGRHFPHPRTVVGYLGKGHNAADTLVALRILRDRFGWKISTRNAYPIDDCAPLVRKKWAELGIPLPLDQVPSWRDADGPLILLDGLLGTGSRGPLRQPLLVLANEMAWLRHHAGARIAAVDLPSGIDPDSGEISADTVVADITFMIGAANRGLLTGVPATAPGALALVPVEPLTAAPNSGLTLISPQTLDFAKSPRPFDFHKGMAGRIAIVAGSEQFPGAAVLAATGALRGGGGLVTLHVPYSIQSQIAAKSPPEIIIRGYENPAEVLESRFDALVVGCGLGELAEEAGLGLISLLSNPAPTVVDADALNTIARSGGLEIFSKNHVLTPHPGEFARLAPDLAGLPREAAAREFVTRTPATLLFKGCRTLVTCHGLPLFVNSTGSPAMATGGHGDFLAGVIGARLARGDSLTEAAALGAWLCGRAAEIALDRGEFSEDTLLPADLSRFLGAAFTDWRSSRR